jgi:hypothetical protein
MSMQPRQSMIALGLLVAAAVSLALAACGGGSENGEQASQAPATTTSSPASQADALEGDWRTDFTCRESLRAVERRLSAKQIHEQVGSLKSFFKEWGEPTKDDPCHGATGTDARLARFADGNLALCDAETLECEVNATYEVVDDHTISVEDPEGNLCPCPATWSFEIAGDELTFRVQPDIYVIATWEAARWIRES